MALFQLLTADVQVDKMTVIHKGIDNPITYPEVLVLQAIFGEENVKNLRDLSEPVDRLHKDERKRLAGTYGGEIVERLFPGIAANLPLAGEKVTRFDVAPRGIEKTPDAKKKAKAVAKAAAKATRGADEDAPVIVREEEDDVVSGEVDSAIDAKV